MSSHWMIRSKIVVLGVLFWLGLTTTVHARSLNAMPVAVSCPGGATLYVNGGASGANTGDSWSNAFTTLQDALTLADSCPAVTQVWVAKGVYYPDDGSGQTNNNRSATFQLRANLAIYGGFAGGETLLADRNWQTNVTVLSGDLDQNDAAKDANGVLVSPIHITGANAYRVVMSNSATVTATAILDGFTITGGKAEGTQNSRCSLECGAAINNDLSSPTLRNLTIISNHAANLGGGIYNLFSHPILQNIIVKANYAGLYGAGIYNSGSNPTMTNILVSGNLAGSRGGALYNNNSSPVIVNATLSGNRATSRAGAIYNSTSVNSSTPSNPSLTNVILWDNSATTNPEVENSPASTTTFRFSLLEGSGGSSSWNTAFGTDSGDNLDVDPLFTTTINPSSAPNIGGNLRLLADSPVADAGLSSANGTSIDVDSTPRHQSADVDLGAYESAHTAQLAVAKWRTPATIEYHETITYTVVVSNTGDAYAYQTLLTDTLPANVTFAHWRVQPTGATYVTATHTVAWEGTVDTSQAITFTFVVTHTGGPNESVTNTVEISHPTGTPSAAATFVVLPLPTVTIVDTTATEMDGQATFTVTLSAPTRKTVSLAYSTTDGSAVAPGDFTTITDSITIAPGTQTALITIPVNNDQVDEDNEDFQITLSAPVNATLLDGSATATISDDDTAGNALSASSLTTSEPNQSALFTITLTSQPEALVTVALASNDTTACSVPNSVILTPSNWQTGVAVAVTAVDDDVVDGDQPCTVQTVVSSADPKYSGMTMSDVAITVQSEDVAGVALTPSTPTVSEPNSASLMTVTLTSQPIAPVQIVLSSTLPTECSIATNVTLTPANWRTGVAVTITAVDENIDDGDRVCTIQTSATSSDANYNQITVVDPPVTVLDNDVAGVAVTPNLLTISEPNSASSFMLKLTSQPRNSVTIRLTSSDTGECRVSPSTVTLDSTNWSVDAVVGVTAVDDAIDDSNQPCTIKTVVTSTDTAYSGINADDVAFTVQDDSDTAGMVVSTTALTVSEPSGVMNYLITLTSQPTASVVVNLTTSDATECKTPSSVTLSSSNWQTGRSVAVTAVDDSIIDGVQSCVVRGKVTSNDPKYSGMNASDVTATVQDNDVAGVLFTLSKSALNEANDSSFLVAKLTSQPASPVTIGLVNSDPTECSLPGSIVLNSANWQTGVGVTILSLNDDVDDESQICTIQTTATSSDTHYNALTVADPTVTVMDDETAGFLLTPTNLTVSEPDSTATFTVALTSQPTATVTLALTSADPSECSAPATLLFNATNWQSGVSATIQANDDRIADGARLCQVSAVATSADGDYHALVMADLDTTVNDDDSAGVSITPEQLTIQEPNGTATFTVTLTSEPTATVTIALSPSDASECSMPNGVTLDAINWEQGVAVPVTTVDDLIDDGDQICTVQTTVSSADGTYAGIAAADVAATVQDDGDTAAVIVASTLLTVSEPAGNATFSVVLASEPTSSVTIAITSDNQQCSATPTLLFTASNWQQGQLVTVSALDDQIVDGVQTCTLHSTATSADATYQAIAVADVAVAVQDDGDTAAITVTPTELSISEPTGQASFIVALTSQPIAAVTIQLSSDDTSECTVPSSVTLDATNWLTGLAVPVSASDDQLDDGAQPCHIQMTATSADSNYDQSAIDDVALTVQDTDLVTMQVAAWPSVTTAQLGEAIVYTYRMTNTGDVTLTVQAVDSKLGAIDFNATRVAPKGVVEGFMNYIVQEADAPGPILTTVTVNGTAELGTQSSASANTAVAITVMPRVEIKLERLGPPQVSEGAIVTYQLSLTNTGFVAAAIESVQGAPTVLAGGTTENAIVEAAGLHALPCTTPLTLQAQGTHRCLLLWKAVNLNGDTVEFGVTVKMNGPLQSTATLTDSATVVVSGPTATAARLFLPLIRRK